MTNQKSKIEINEMRDLYTQAFCRAAKDTRAYKYLIFSKYSGLQNDGCDISIDEIKWCMTTEKVRQTIDMWIRLSMAKRDSNQITLGEDDMVRVDLFDIPNGNVAKIVNFSGKVGLSSALAENGRVLVETEYYFDLTKGDTLKKEIEDMVKKSMKDEKAAKSVAESISKYSNKLMDPVSPTVLNANYKTMLQYCNFNTSKVSKQHIKLSDLTGFCEGKFVYTIEGLTTQENGYGVEAVSILNITSPFAKALDDITEDLTVISRNRKVDWLSESFKSENK